MKFIFESVDRYAELAEKYLDSSISESELVELSSIVEYNAKRAGYNKKVCHGTTSDFTEFKFGDIGFHVGTYEQATDRVSGLRNSKVLMLYASIHNPLNVAFDFGDWHGKNVASMLYETEQWENGYDKGAEEINARLLEISSMEDNNATDNILKDFIVSLGYDSIKYENQFENADYSGNNCESYIVFHPSQLKSADLVTVDNNENIIPIYKRFKNSSNNIYERYNRWGVK